MKAPKPKGKPKKQHPAASKATASPLDVVDHIRAWITTEKLQPGERLPAEREMATRFGVTRGDIRRGIGYLSALGVLEVRHGVGAFLSSAPTALGDIPLQWMRATGTLQTHHLFEARRAIEGTIAGLAAQHCREEQLGPIAEELAEMFATADDPESFLIHDIRFHRAVAQASGNPILASMMESIAGGLYEERHQSAGTTANRQSALVAHRKIYHALRRHDADGARRAMSHHLDAAESGAD